MNDLIERLIHAVRESERKLANNANQLHVDKLAADLRLELERIAELEPQADAYNFACEDMEKFQRERFEAGKEVGTQGSLCDGMAWVYGRLSELEAEVARLRKLLEPPKSWRDDPELEAKAKAIYETWKDQDGWVPWVAYGNSTKQDEARAAARKEPS